MKILKSIIYISKSTREASASTLRSILESSTRNNPQREITGLLVFRHGRFLQLLEGPHDQVDALLEIIEKDPRHRQIQILANCDSQERITPEWHMGWIAPDSNPETTEQILALFHQGSPGKAYQSPEALRALLRLFSKGATLLDPDRVQT